MRLKVGIAVRASYGLPDNLFSSKSSSSKRDRPDRDKGTFKERSVMWSEARARPSAGAKKIPTHLPL
jgi:hypothetical protein